MKTTKHFALTALLVLGAIPLLGLFGGTPALAGPHYPITFRATLINVGDEPKATGDWTLEWWPGYGELTVGGKWLTPGATYAVEIDGYFWGGFVARSSGKGDVWFPDADIPSMVRVYRVDSAGPVLVLAWPFP